MTSAANKRGFLTKEGGVHKSWKRRWCVLSGSTLNYYKNPEDAAAQGTIYLEEYKDVCGTDSRPKVSNCFALLPVDAAGRTYYFTAESETDMREWIAVIKGVLEKISSTSNRQKRLYVTAEVGIVRGLRISGSFPTQIARELTEGVPIAAKNIDDRGWFVDEIYTIEQVLSVFSKYNWHLANMYEVPMLLPKKLSFQPAISLILWVDIHQAATGLRVLLREASVKRTKAPGIKPPVLVPPTPGFRIEDGVSGKLFKGVSDVSVSAASVENPESENAWYRLYFVGREHEHFISDDQDDAFVMSIIREVDRQTSSAFYQYRAIVWLKTGNEQLTIPVQEKEMLTPSQILEIAAPQLAILQNTLRQVSSTSPVGADLETELIKMENEQCNVDFKFGVLYCKKGQTIQDEMFGNEKSSKELDEFLAVIGDRIQLKGWTGYRGGLSITGETTGKESVFTKFGGYNIMWHVSTLLPYNASDAQQLERKRHIGNDIVTIVFQDEPGLRFSPLTISSQFLHIFVVVERIGMVNGVPQYRMNVCTNDKVPVYGPALPYPATWNNPDAFRQFLLAKMINAEKAAYKAPAFMTRRKRTLQLLLQSIQEKFLPEAKRGVAQRRLNQEAQVNKRSGGEACLDDGDDRRWLLRTEVTQTSHEAICGSVWDDERLVVGTSTGLAVLHLGNGQYDELPTAKARRCNDVCVVEDMGIAVTLECRTNGGHPYLFVYDLPALQRGDATGMKIEDAKNVSAMDLRTLKQSSELMMIYVLKRQLLLNVWQPARSCFTKLREYTPLQDQPLLVKFIDDERVVIGAASGFVIMQLKDGGVQHIPLSNQPPKMEPVSIIPLSQEILLSYNAFSAVVSLEGKQTRDIIFKWSATPISIVFLNPVVVGITAAQIEIRSLLNGNLLETRPCLTSNMLSVRTANMSHASQVFLSSTADDSSQIMRLMFASSTEANRGPPRLTDSFTSQRSVQKP